MLPVDHRGARWGRRTPKARLHRKADALDLSDNRGVGGACSAFRKTGFVWIRSVQSTPAAAFAVSQQLLVECGASSGHDALSVLGDFILPPSDGEPTRDFQTLHFDFGVPLRPLRDRDVARYTALFIPRSAVRVAAVTRLVSLAALLGQRRWPDRATRLDNVIAYGESHGSWDDADGYCEGSLGRIVEAVAGAPRLPSVKSTPGFLCGMEFENLAAELSFFKWHGLDVNAAQIEVPLRPGDLLLFDNLAFAHGRRGTRTPGELHQRVYGNRSLSPAAQRTLRDRFLAVFAERQPARPQPALSTA